MANSSTNIDLIATSQAQKEVTANAYFDAASPAALFGRRASQCSGLTWGYYGGAMVVDGALTAIANAQITLAANSTNYIEATRAGIVSSNTSGFTAGRTPLYAVATGAASVTSYTDYRITNAPTTGRRSIAIADANTTLAAIDLRCQILEITGTLTAQRNIVLPLDVAQWTVYNATAGGFGLQFIGATGTGVVVAAAKRAILYTDGTNIVRATADV